VSRNKRKQVWVIEKFSPGEEHRHRLKRVLVQKQTPFQKLIIADSYSFGRCLILDEEIQSALADEFIYHEALVHPALIVHPKPERVLILGGGEGSTAREILRYKSVREIIMIDIDEKVVKFCMKYLKQWHQGSFFDQRVQLVYDDARHYIEKDKSDNFDVIISDLPCPIKGGPAGGLYTHQFYQSVKKRLNQGGIFVAQAGSVHPVQIDFHSLILKTLSRVFKRTASYYEFVPSFDVPWAFVFASDTHIPLALSARQINTRLAVRKIRGLRYYNGEAHHRIFCISRHIAKRLASEKAIITDSHLAYFYK